MTRGWRAFRWRRAAACHHRRAARRRGCARYWSAVSTFRSEMEGGGLGCLPAGGAETGSLRWIQRGKHRCQPNSGCSEDWAARGGNPRARGPVVGSGCDCVGLKAKTPEGLNLDNAAVAHVVVLLEKRGDSKKVGTRRSRERRRPSDVELLGPCLRSFDQSAEDGAGRLVFIHRALGMPLHGEHKVIRSSSFQGLDDAVVRAAAAMRRPSPIVLADW